MLPPAAEKPNAELAPPRTAIGWQGIRFELPPDWNLVALSMDRDRGSLRVDAPGESALVVHLRWINAAIPEQRTAYYLLAPHFRRWLRRPEPPVPKPNLQATLEKILKDAEKQAKRSKTRFESNVKPEKTEGAEGERAAINFTWTGEGRGQGKIWHCAHCHRVVVAQVLGRAKDQGAIQNVASQLFSTLHDHPQGGYDYWALYDLQMEIPDDFRLEAQQVKAGYLHLTFRRGGERIIVDRWGLANMTLKKFTLAEWFQNNAILNLKRREKTETTVNGHETIRHSGALPPLLRLKSLRDGKFRRIAARYEAGCWRCEESNKIYLVQAFLRRDSEQLWEEVTSRCACH